ncbi:MAG: hypothetical protein FWC41_02130, partial [Firmicutes bacterium]|nr:hypothetical protein [Bacillota bacterium]
LVDILEMIEADASYDEMYETIGGYLVEAKSEGQLKSREYTAQKFIDKHNKDIKDLEWWRSSKNSYANSREKDVQADGDYNREKLVKDNAPKAARLQNRLKELQTPRPTRTPKPLNKAYPSRKPIPKKPFPLQKPSKISNANPVPDPPNQWKRKENIKDVIARIKR